MKRKNIPFMAGLALGAGLLGQALVKRARRTRAEGLAWQKLRREGLDVFACPECRGALTIVSLQAEGGYLCPTCQKVFPIIDGIPHFIETQILTGLNKRFLTNVRLVLLGLPGFLEGGFCLYRHD